MTTEQFRVAMRNRPFRPFVLRTADGEKYPITHPEMAIASETGRTVAVSVGGEAFAILDSLLVTAIEFEKATAP